MKTLLSIFAAVLILAPCANAQSIPLYVGFNYSNQLGVIDTAVSYDVSEFITLTSTVDGVDGCYGLALEPFSGEMYILYQTDGGSATNRRLGTVDVTTGVITDIGDAGNMTDIAFYNSNLYAFSGSYSGQGFYSVDITDGSTTLLLNPSSDNEAGAIVHNFYANEMFFVDEDHFTTIDLITNTEDVDMAFLGFDDECNAIAMKNDNIALVSNYDDLYEFNLTTYEFDLVANYDNNLHAMAFAELPLIVTINGPTDYCSTDPSTLAVNEVGGSYQWYVDALEIPGATAATYEPLVSGTYFCVVDGEETKNTITVEVTASPEVSFTATPNPVSLITDPTGTVSFTNTTPTGDSFFWDFDNGFTTTTENPSFPFTMVGEYDVTLHVTDSESECTGTASVTVVVTDIVGIEVNEKNFSIFPTVTATTVNLAYTGGSVNLTAALIDMSGRTVLTQAIQSSNTTFDLSTLNSGTYLIRVIDKNNTVATFKVTKQ